MKIIKTSAIASAASLAIAAFSVSVAGNASATTSAVAGDPHACFDQPGMARALDALRAARSSLDHAEHNKGGWRDNAIKSTEAAIKEAERGCAFANDHH